MHRKLPVPEGMSPVARARVKPGDLPVGGAPPISSLPRFDKMPPPHAIPRAAEGQLPQQQQPPRSPEEIKADWERASQLLSQGKVPPTNRPEDARPLQDTSRPPLNMWKKEDYSNIAAPWDVQQVAPPPPAPPSVPPPQSEGGTEDGGPTFGELSDFDWDAYHMEQKNSDFRAPEIKAAIQARSSDIDIGDIILYESVEQRQIIIPDKLEVVFRTLTANEDIAIKDYIYRLVGGTRYVVDMLTLMTLTCGLKAFNDAELPDHMALEAGERVWNDEKFEAKMRAVKGLGIQVVSLLSITYFWFDQSVRKKLVAGVLGKS